ncbi:hypothetical protein ACFO5O_00815 [Geojedonia litorea]|uniref:Uncharacterized protein n=1 Tax=Geojedonia litorea TaxID=1268269 RepID=A0ABV9N0P6_9FLAO
MKRIYLSLFLCCTSFFSFSQSGCSDAQAHIVYAFNNAKTSLEANNFTHLKYYADKSLEAFKRVQNVLSKCDCENVEDYTYESIEKLSKVPGTEKMHDAQYFVAKAKDYAQKIITQLDYCTSLDVTTATDYQISDLEKEQLRLKQQQDNLRRQQEALQAQLAKQKEEELVVEKQQLILKTNAAITKHVQAYNDALNALNSKTKIKEDDLKQSENQLISKSVDEIKTYYLKSIKDLTTNYMNVLSTLDLED